MEIVTYFLAGTLIASVTYFVGALFWLLVDDPIVLLYIAGVTALGWVAVTWAT